MFSAVSPQHPPRKIVAVGHRGTKKFAPENTLIAHDIAYEKGARAIEFDIRCTKDGHFVLMHNPFVNLTTDGSGWIADMSLKQVQALDAGGYKGDAFKDTRVPTLREALRHVRGRYAVDLDFKGGPKNSAEILYKVLEEEGPFEHLITIFVRRRHWNLIKDLSANYAVRPHFISRAWTQKILRSYPIEIMGLRRKAFSPERAEVIRKAGLHLFSNVMGKYDRPSGFRTAVDAGSMFIQTDHIDELVSFLKERDLLQTGVLGPDYRPLDAPETPRADMPAIRSA